jgi:hypothetical protein
LRATFNDTFGGVAVKKLWAGLGAGLLIIAGLIVFVVMPTTKHVIVTNYQTAEWQNLRGSLITKNILKSPFEPARHHGLVEAIDITVPPPPFGSDVATFFPQSLIRQWIKSYEGTTYTPAVNLAKKLGMTITLASIDLTTDWTGLKIQLDIQAHSSVTNATGVVKATGLLTYDGEGKDSNGKPTFQFRPTLSDISADLNWRFLDIEARNLITQVINARLIEEFAKKLVFPLPATHPFPLDLRQTQPEKVDEKPKHDDHTDFSGLIDVKIFNEAGPISLTEVGYLLPPIFTDHGIWLIASARNPGSEDSYFEERTPATDDAYPAAIEDLKSKVSWIDETSINDVGIIYLGSDSLIKKLISDIYGGGDHILVSATLHDTVGSIWKEAISGGLFRPHIEVLTREIVSATATAKLSTPKITADPAKPSYSLELPTTVNATAYIEISLDSGVGTLPKIPVTVDAGANYTFTGTLGFEVVSLPAGNALLLTPDLTCNLLHPKFVSRPFKPKEFLRATAETSFAVFLADQVEFDTDIVMNEQALKSTAMPDLDSVPKRIPTTGPKLDGLNYSHAFADLTLSPISVSRTNRGIEVITNTSMTPVLDTSPNHSADETRQQDGVNALQTARTASRSCPPTGDWHAQVGAINLGPKSAVIKAAATAIQTGAMAADDLVIDPVKELLKGNPADMVSAAPELKFFRDVIDDKLPPHTAVRETVDTVDDAVNKVADTSNHVFQDLVVKPVEKVATGTAKVAKGVSCKFGRTFNRKHASC